MRRHLTVANRIKRRSAVVLALATAGALAVAGIAAGAPNGDSSAVRIFSFFPNHPGANYIGGQLTVHTNTSYANPGCPSPGGCTERIQLSLDDDFQFNPNLVPKCDPANLVGKNMQQALQTCGPGAGAAKNAWLWPANSATANGSATIFCPYPYCGPSPGVQIKGCLLVFNGQGSTSEVLLLIRFDPNTPNLDCTNPKSNQAGGLSRVLRGDLKANPSTLSTDYTAPDNCSPPDPRSGCQIDFNHIDDYLEFPLTDLHLSVKRSNYIRARCVDPPAGNRTWNSRTKFTYNDGQEDTVSKSQSCA